MKVNKILRILSLALILALLLTILPATPVLAVGDLRIEPDQGKIGDEVEVWGTDFDSGSVRFYFSDEIASPTDRIDVEISNYTYLGGKTVDDTGTFERFYFNVPSRLIDGDDIEDVRGGTYYIYATNYYRDILDRVTFTIETIAVITLDPIEGMVGTEAKISGSGFATDITATIKFDGTQVGTTQTDSAGSFTNVAFAVPESHQGSHTVEVIDVSNNSDTASFTVKQSITVSAASGVAGETVTVSGTGFKASTGITIIFGNSAVTTNPASITTNSKGSFSASFTVPARASGTYIIEISDGTNSADANFSIGTAVITLNPTSGYAGTEVTVSGIGFQANKPITITFYNEAVITPSTGANGKFSARFNVPALAAGTYQVKASDGINTPEVYFKIGASSNINPVTSAASPGHIGTEVTVSGVGFIANRTVTINYDGKQVTTGTISVDGTFSATFEVPPSKGGQHSIVASDGTNNQQLAFFMESTAPPIPMPLLPEMETKTEATAHFDWEDATDPSGATYTLQVATSGNFSQDSIVLEKAALIESEYTLTEEEKLESASKEAPYYWHVKATDGALNESQWSGTGSFYTGFSLSLPQPLIYTFFGIGALLFGVFGFWLGRKTSYY